MVKVDESFILSYKKEGHEFQVLVDYGKLLEFRKNNAKITVYEVLADEDVFSDVKKGFRQSENLIKEIFRGKNEEAVFSEILNKGHCQVPTKYLNKQREKIKTRVVQYIVDSCINPQTNGKFTSSMIENEISKISYGFKGDSDHIHQAEEVIKKLQSKFPIKIDKKTLKISIPAQYVGKFYGKIFRSLGTITKEFIHKSSGNLKVHMDVNSSNFDKVIEYIRLNSNGEGEYYSEN
jgi:rRNA metabolism SBDS family protein